MESLNRLFRDPLFVAGFALRVVLLFVLAPTAVSDWFAPFLAHSVSAARIDPWTSFLATGGDRLAFPYGYAMWLAFLPLSLLSALSGLPPAAGYGATLLLADMALLAVLRSLTGAAPRLLVLLYWLSPIVLFATYWLGLNDLIPILLLMLALGALRDFAPLRSGAWLALAVSAKLSMILAAPFFFFYLIHNKRLRLFFAKFAAAFAVALLLLEAPHLLSAGGREMLLGNTELAKVYEISIPFGSGQRVYLLPLVYLLALFGAWRVRRMSFELLLTLIGIAFFLVLLLSPAQPGWFVWVLPFLVVYQIKSGRVGTGLVAGFSLLYIAMNSLVSNLPGLPIPDWPVGARAVDLLAIPTRMMSVGQTLLLAAGLILAARMLREGVQANEYFRLSRKPFVVGISGDSGAGKDTLADAISGLFGRHSVARVSGDDYHLWDRHKPMWQVMTHLNPRANNLARFTQDVQALANGNDVLTRHYDHASGKMSKPRTLQSNHFIVVSGLHALYLPLLRELYDLKIFLAMDEGLRRHLKVRRDVSHRGHDPNQVLAAFGRREPDSRRFIEPQKAYADLVLALEPIHPDTLAEPNAPLRLKLNVHARQGTDYEDVVRVLVGVCGLHVDLNQEGAEGGVELTIEGETDADDVAFASRELLPQLSELLDVRPEWQAGMQGVVQLIVLTHITHALRARLL